MSRNQTVCPRWQHVNAGLIECRKRIIQFTVQSSELGTPGAEVPIKREERRETWREGVVFLSHTPRRLRSLPKAFSVAPSCCAICQGELEAAKLGPQRCWYWPQSKGAREAGVPDPVPGCSPTQEGSLPSESWSLCSRPHYPAIPSPNFLKRVPSENLQKPNNWFLFTYVHVFQIFLICTML